MGQSNICQWGVALPLWFLFPGWVSSTELSCLLSCRAVSPPPWSWECSMSRLSGFYVKLACLLRMKLASSVWSSLGYFLPWKEGLISRWHMDATEAQTGSAGCEQWLSLVGQKKVVLFYLIWNLVIGNIDLPNDLFCFPMVFWVGVPGAREHRLGTYPAWGKFWFLFWDREEEPLAWGWNSIFYFVLFLFCFIFLGIHHSTDN